LKKENHRMQTIYHSHDGAEDAHPLQIAGIGAPGNAAVLHPPTGKHPSQVRK
jgi:hypothetical protein